MAEEKRSSPVGNLVAIVAVIAVLTITQGKPFGVFVISTLIASAAYLIGHAAHKWWARDRISEAEFSRFVDELGRSVVITPEFMSRFAPAPRAEDQSDMDHADVQEDRRRQRKIRSLRSQLEEAHRSVGYYAARGEHRYAASFKGRAAAIESELRSLGA